MRLTIRNKLFGLSILGIFLAVAIGATGHWGVRKVDTSNREILTTAAANRNHIEGALMHDALKSDVYAALLANTTAEQQKARQDLADHSAAFRKRLEANKALPLTGDVKKALEEIGPSLEEYIASAEIMSELAIKDRKMAREQLSEFLKVFDQLQARQAQVSDLIERSARESQAAAGQTSTTSQTAIQIICIVTLVVLAVSSFLIIRSITQPLEECVGLMDQIAQGDLTKRLQVNRTDELGNLARAVNQMQDSLRVTIESVSATAERVATGSEEISSSATQQAQGAETQKDQAHQVATAMQEMAATVLQVTENSNKAAGAAQKAADTARDGGKIVEQTLLKMRAISNSVGETARKVQDLGESSNQIGEIIGVIDDIADQTNLLALNAAIEAARAGEQGRGFAVVADEVRKLAERTSKATKEIAQMIKSIQLETRSAVEAMQAGTRQVNEGVETTTAAGQSLAEIIRMAEQVGEMVTQIATASTQQSSAAEEVNESVEQIAKITLEATSGAKQSAKACQELSGLALDLQNLVGKFKVSDNGNQG